MIHYIESGKPINYTLKDGTIIKGKTLRIKRNGKKMVYYTETGVKALLNTNTAPEELIKVEELKKLNEKSLMRMGYLAEIVCADVKERR